MKAQRRARKEESKRRIAYVAARAPLFEPLTRYAGRATLRLLKDEKGTLVHVGTGVLTKLRDHVFILTAQHVLKDLAGFDVYTPIAGKIMSLGGWGHGSTVLDAGIFHVENPDLSSFLDAALPGGAVFAQSDVLGDRLALFGHPANPIPKDGAATIYQLRGKALPFYKRLNFNPQTNILLNYPKKVIGPHGSVRYPPLEGMSGSGLWFAPQLTERAISIHAPGPLPRLVGVFTAQRRRDNCLVATNVQHHVMCIWQRFPFLLERYRAEYERLNRERQQFEKKLGLDSVSNPEVLRSWLERLWHDPRTEY